MKADKRKIWTYSECRIIPISCQDPVWGKSSEPIDFGDGVSRNRFWRIGFPNGSYQNQPTKKAVRKEILARLFSDGKGKAGVVR